MEARAQPVLIDLTTLQDSDSESDTTLTTQNPEAHVDKIITTTGFPFSEAITISDDEDELYLEKMLID